METIILLIMLALVLVWLYFHDRKNDLILREIKADSEIHKEDHKAIIKRLHRLELTVNRKLEPRK